MKQSFLITCLCIIGFSATAQRPTYLRKDSIHSALDGVTQVFYYDKSTADTPQPLVVELHSWSNSADSQMGMIATQVHAKNWNYIFPNFRGVNNHPKACCSEFVLSDIDEAIDKALAAWPQLARGELNAAATRLNARPAQPKPPKPAKLTPPPADTSS